MLFLLKLKCHSHNSEAGDWQADVQRLQAGAEMRYIVLFFMIFYFEVIDVLNYYFLLDFCC